MKITRTLMRTSLGLFTSGLFAAAALAGPPPQFWNRPAAKPAAQVDAPAKVETPAPAKCDGCERTPIWVSNDRSPAGKGAPAARVVGSKHSCSRCTGVTTAQNGKVKNNMTHAAGCAALLCCK